MDTGWTNEQPEAERQAMPLTEALLAHGRGEQQPGAVLETALARARAQEAAEARRAAEEAPDPDERAAGMIARGVMPGMLSGLSQRLGDTLAELAGEEEKLEKSRKRQERIQRDHQAGRITAFDIARMDFEEGDPARVATLERRAESLRRQLAEVTQMVTPQREQLADPLEAASRHARSVGHQAFLEATRERWAEARQDRPAGRRPFASISRGADVPAEVTCPECIAVGADAEQSFAIHHDPELLALDGQGDEPSRSRRTGAYGYGDYSAITR